MRLKQQQALMQQSLYHPGLLPPPPQIEPILSGNLPPRFDSATCRSVYVGNIHSHVSESLLQEVFSNTGPLEGCKLIRKEKSSYGFVDYFDRRSAALAIVTLNGRQLFGQPIKVNWAYASSQREDTSGHFNIFVGDLSPEVTDATLFAFFSVYPTCSDAKVMWDQKTGRSRGFGFVSFRSQQDAQSAINDMTGKWLGSRQMRCNWGSKNPGADENLSSDSRSNVVELTTGILDEDGQEKAKDEDAPENNPQYTTVYVGNLVPEVNKVDLHRHFHLLNAGIIEDVRVQRDKGFGFVRFSNHDEAKRAIKLGNARILFGKPIKCSWGSKPTIPGTTSSILPHMQQQQSLLAADVAAAYQCQVALAKMSGLTMDPQDPGQATYGGGGGFANVPAGAPQLPMYYQ
jgi:nucleolysin TIA-1/TIAR